jgi:hypothetical protein
MHHARPAQDRGAGAGGGWLRTDEIAAITGHKSRTEVERYTKQADRKRLATAMILRLEKNADRASVRTPSLNAG